MAQNGAQYAVQRNERHNEGQRNKRPRHERQQNTWPLTTGLYVYNNVLHILYYDERNIEDRPVGISVSIEPFEDPFVYFVEGYTPNHTRALNNFVYYGRNHDEVNQMRTIILNRTNEARNLLTCIINTYID
jgi:hypothetical protein